MTRKVTSNRAWARAYAEWVKLRAVPPLLRPANLPAFKAGPLQSPAAALTKQVVMPLDHTIVAARDFVADARLRAHTCMIPQHQADRALNQWGLCPCWLSNRPLSGRTPSR